MISVGKFLFVAQVVNLLKKARVSSVFSKCPRGSGSRPRWRSFSWSAERVSRRRAVA